MKFLLVLLLFPLSLHAEKVKILVPGMTCEACVQAMKKNFKEVVKDPNEHVLVNLQKKEVLLITEKPITDDEIKQRVKAAGYHAVSITHLKQ